MAQMLKLQCMRFITKLLRKLKTNEMKLIDDKYIAVVHLNDGISTIGCVKVEDMLEDDYGHTVAIRNGEYWSTGTLWRVGNFEIPVQSIKFMELADTFFE